MNVRRLTLISMTAIGLALSGSAFADEPDQGQHHAGQHRDADAAMAMGDDHGDSADMGMMCKTMMAHMMGKGPMMSKRGMMGGGMSDMQKMSAHRMAKMAHAGLPKLMPADAVKAGLEAMIADNKRLKLGKLEPGGDFTMSAEITTIEGSLVHKLLIDRRDGDAWEVD